MRSRESILHEHVKWVTIIENIHWHIHMDVDSFLWVAGMSESESDGSTHQYTPSGAICIKYDQYWFNLEQMTARDMKIVDRLKFAKARVRLMQKLLDQTDEERQHRTLYGSLLVTY